MSRASITGGVPTTAKSRPDRELALEAIVGDGQGGCDGNRFVTRVGIDPGRIVRDDVHVPPPREAMLRRASAASGKISRRADGPAASPQACRHESRAGPDLSTVPRP